MTEVHEQETIELNRVCLKMEGDQIRVLEDTFLGTPKEAIYKVDDPQQLKGYKMKFVMKNKLGKVIPRPQDTPLNIEHYVVFSDPSEKEKHLDALADSIGQKIHKHLEEVESAKQAMLNYKETKQPHSHGEAPGEKRGVLLRNTVEQD